MSTHRRVSPGEIALLIVIALLVVVAIGLAVLPRPAHAGPAGLPANAAQTTPR